MTRHVTGDATNPIRYVVWVVVVCISIALAILGHNHLEETLDLHLEDEEVMCLSDTLPGTDRSVRVQVNVTFANAKGVKYHGTREITIRLRRETDTDIQNGR